MVVVAGGGEDVMLGRECDKKGKWSEKGELAPTKKKMVKEEEKNASKWEVFLPAFAL